MARQPLETVLASAAACPADVVEWAEREGHANMRAHVETAAGISAQAGAMLTLLLGGVGGALAWAVRLAEPGAGPVAWGAGAVCVWWGLVAAYLNAANLQLVDAPMVSNQPAHLLMPGATLDQLRRGELVNLEERIRQQRDMNVRRAAALNLARYLALAGPLVFAAGAWAGRCWA